MKAFQITLIGIFIALGVIGTLMFAGYIPSPGGGSSRANPVTLQVWGTLPSNKITSQLDAFEVGDKVTLRYTQKQESDLEIDLLRAIASNSQPDLVIFPHEQLVTLKDSLFPIEESEGFDTRDFRNTYIEGAEIFVEGTAISALPLLVDPMVMYWNRDTFNNERITQVPDTWTNVIDFSNQVTKRDSRGKILESAIALGEADNINYFKNILSLLLLQAGDDVVARDANGTPQVVLGNNIPGQASGQPPAESALSFYSGFSDPVKRHYSWNTSLQPSANAFSLGDLALYLAPASEYENIKSRNPLLNYDVAPVPQLEVGTDANYGTIYAVGIVKNSPNFNQAFPAAFFLSFASQENQRLLEDIFFLPSARRDLLSGGSTDPVMSVFYDGAIITRTWLDPNPGATENVFRKMVRDVSINVTDAGQAIVTAKNALRSLVNQAQ
ncbi:hypothetical protein CL654_01675 [bacterium]|nr:hypothetical protein [bacterium]|tara:strand:- start:16566 stop:17885 length:1320 start_codon:yes stop_codon:yes gene_type:complete